MNNTLALLVVYIRPIFRIQILSHIRHTLSIFLIDLIDYVQTIFRIQILSHIRHALSIFLIDLKDYVLSLIEYVVYIWCVVAIAITICRNFYIIILIFEKSVKDFCCLRLYDL